MLAKKQKDKENRKVVKNVRQMMTRGNKEEVVRE
jgi:hypothetical protein